MQAVIYLKTNFEEARKMGINGVKYVENNVSIKAVGLNSRKFLKRMWWGAEGCLKFTA